MKPYGGTTAPQLGIFQLCVILLPVVTKGGNTTTDPVKGGNNSTTTDTTKNGDTTKDSTQKVSDNGTNTTPASSDGQSSTFIETKTENGQTLTVTRTEAIGASNSPSSDAANSNDANAKKSGGVSPGAIIGISVAAGLAFFGMIGFLIWRYSKRRNQFSSFLGNDDIKWPDFDSHGGNVETSHPLPVRETGRSGFETSPTPGSNGLMDIENYSSAELSSHGGSQDPYAVPPLPHLNPNQPYLDDPTAASGYYDPKHGPVSEAQLIEHGSEWQGGVPPDMTQLPPGLGYTAERMSPGPYAAYGGGEHMGRAASPGPLVAYGEGRVSPESSAAHVGQEQVSHLQR
ncbi:hypothetical protein D9611_008149 [Ephemerocybe angulata]|uniref:Uncharacterized protein n=1 Tax=Ephemerocybe angulata TaxID=980116 RepID=A0A8H5FD51_9AGAR|nr:hypothetical protein D9611_008149 [Tulosesus angulatus]